MNRFFVDEIIENKAEITDSDFNHCKNVLRLKEGTEIFLVCNGIEYQAKVDSFESKSVVCEILYKSEIQREPSINVNLYQCLPKSAKMETIIQKNVEIGINKIIPVISRRTIIKISDQSKEMKKVERWNKISEEASKQSMRNNIPEVCSIITFKEMINHFKTSLGLLIVPYEDEEYNSLRDIELNEKEANILIGPEGGFDPEEIQELKEINAKIVTLGPRILRTETAGMVTNAILMYKSNNI